MIDALVASYPLWTDEHGTNVRQLAEIRTRIEELGRMEKALNELAASCPREGSANDCSILNALIQPA